MAIGFGATKGVGSTDVVQTNYTGNPATRSIAFWFNRHGAGGGNTGRFITQGVSTGGLVIVAWNATSPNVRFSHVFSGVIGSWGVTTASTADTWIHLGITYNNGNVANVPIIYVNGVAQSLTTLSTPTGTASTLAEGWLLGNRNTGASNFDGMLAELGFWDVILTAAEMKALGAGRFSPLSIRKPKSYVKGVRSVIDELSATALTITGTAVQPHIPIVYPGRVDTASAPGVRAISGSAAATSGQTGALGGTGALAGTNAAQTGQAGAIGGLGALVGTAAGQAAQTGALTGAGALAGTVAGQAGQAGLLTGDGSLSGTGAAQSGQAGVLGGAGSLSGSSAATGAQTGALVGTGALAGSVAAQAGQSGELVADGALAGAAGVVGGQSGQLVGSGALAGAGAAQAGQSGTLVGDGALAGSADAVAGQSGLVTSSDGLAGVASALAGQSGQISGGGALAGSLAGTAGQSGAITGVGALAGSAAGTAGQSGTIVDAGAPPPPIHVDVFVMAVAMDGDVSIGATMDSTVLVAARTFGL